MSAAEFWRPTSDGVVVTCRLTPKGGRDALDGPAALGDGTRVLAARVRTAPEDGRANDALRALLARALAVPVSCVTIAAGAKSRVKQVAVVGDSGALILRLKTM
jgi:uncharacterized protein YggU (UPF0235/DUF167 family)